MKNWIAKTGVVAFGCAALFVAAWPSLQAQAQPSPLAATDFHVVIDYYDPPHESQAKSIISGKEAQPLPGGRYLIKETKLETFRVNGEHEMILESPECILDWAKRLAGSPDHLQVQSGDGKFSVDGDGYRWQQSEGLTISNRIHAVIQRAVTNTAVPPLVITSRWFSFDATNQYAVFHEDVHGDDPEMEFTCGQLKVHALPAQHSFETIEAEQSPVIIGKADGRRATADRVIYTRADDRSKLIGNVTWQRGRESGRADRAEMRRREKDFSADGHVAMKLPQESLAAGGLLQSGTNSLAAVNENSPLVDLSADQFHSQPDLSVATGSVLLVDGTNRLSCDKLTMESPSGTTSNETAIAVGDVVVERGGGTLHADQAVYNRADAAIVFTGEPKWIQPQTEGRAERVTIHNQTGEIHAENHVDVKVSSGRKPGSLLTMFPASTGTNGALREIEVFAQEFTAMGHDATFLGNVRAHQLPITGSEPRLRSKELEVNFTASNQVESIHARRDVVCEQGLAGVTNGPAMYRKLSSRSLTSRSDPKTGALSNLVAEGDVRMEQPGSLATGGRATYNAASDLLELTDRPRLETPQLIVTDARTLFWDKTKNRFLATGLFKINIKPGAVKEATDVLKPR